MTIDSTPTPAEPLTDEQMEVFHQQVTEKYGISLLGHPDRLRWFLGDFACAARATPAAPAEIAQPQMGTVLINGHRYRRPVITVAVVTVDGTSCVVPANELADIVGDGGEYTVQIKTMRLAEFERMPEFGGW